MNYVNAVVLPRPHNIEFKCIGKLIFDFNYANYIIHAHHIESRWFNSKEQYHREDGPASFWNDGYQYWCRYDEYHREDGPAEIWNNGSQYWWLNDIEYSEEEFNDEIRRRNELRKHNSLTETT